MMLLKGLLYGEAPPKLSTPYPLKHHPGGKIGTLLYSPPAQMHSLFYTFDGNAIFFIRQFIQFLNWREASAGLSIGKCNGIVLLSPFCQKSCGVYWGLARGSGRFHGGVLPTLSKAEFSVFRRFSGFSWRLSYPFKYQNYFLTYWPFKIPEKRYFPIRFF